MAGEARGVGRRRKARARSRGSLAIQRLLDAEPHAEAVVLAVASTERVFIAVVVEERRCSFNVHKGAVQAGKHAHPQAALLAVRGALELHIMLGPVARVELGLQDGCLLHGCCFQRRVKLRCIGFGTLQHADASAAQLLRRIPKEACQVV